MPACADDVLQGRVEGRHAAARLTRPAMPSKPAGEALEYVSNSAARGQRKSGFDLAASSVSNMLDKGSFDLNKGSGPGDKAELKADLDTTDKELVIAWEDWHRRLCKDIYNYWLDYGNIPGEGSVMLHVNRSGDIDFELQNFHVDAAEQFSPRQKEMFERSISRTLQMLDHTDTLAFPERSQRQTVNLSTRFTFTETGAGPQGYSWKRGDYERVNSR